MSDRSDLSGKKSVPPRGSGWVRSLGNNHPSRLRTHPLPRGGTDFLPPSF